MRRSLLAKFLLSVVPVFVLASGAGLSWLAEHGIRGHLDELTARVGNHAAQVAAVVGRPGVLGDEATASRVLATLLADRAVQCAEVDAAGPEARRLLAPPRVGCLGQEPGERLELGVAGPARATLVVRFSTREIDEARAARREFSLLAVALGFVLAVGASAAGFQWTVGAPLRRLLDAIRETSASGRFALVGRVGADEIGRVAEAFNAMQIGLQSREERLSAALEELTAQNARFDAALRNMSQGLCMLDADRRLAICNERFAELYGLAPGLARPGAPVSDLLAPHGAAPGGPGDGLRSVLAGLLDAGGRASAQADLADGRTVAVSCEPMAGGGWVTTHEDVTERRRAEARLAHMARHDALTDLGNRVLFREGLERSLLRLGRGGGEAAVLCLDLDRFKAVNDTLGHAAGDALLRAVADRLRSCLRGADAAARLGGDEFAVVQVGAAQPAGAAALARRLVEAIGAPYDIDGHRVVVGTSVGVALAPRDGTDPDLLVRNADTALYRAKAEGRGGFRFFEAGMDERVRERAALEAELRLAVAHDELVPHFQPLVGLETGRLLGFEALARWPHPARGGSVPPSAFIPIAEGAGLVAPMTERLLRKVCRAARAWPGHLTVAVNVSPVQLRDRALPGVVRSVLEETGLPARRLELELTESALVGDLDLAREVMGELKALGVRLALDDFGTGYSSLAHLQALPLDKIKIDAGFVRAMARDPGSRKIVAAVVALGHSLGLPTVAEGVEERGEAEALRRLGCDAGQGWLFGRPVPAGAVGAMLAAEAGAVPS